MDTQDVQHAFFGLVECMKARAKTEGIPVSDATVAKMALTYMDLVPDTSFGYAHSVIKDKLAS